MLPTQVKAEVTMTTIPQVDLLTTIPLTIFELEANGIINSIRS